MSAIVLYGESAFTATTAGSSTRRTTGVMSFTVYFASDCSKGLVSQLPVKSWHAQIGDPTLADSILDRLVHNAYRLDLTGESIRKKKGRGSSEQQPGGGA